MNEAPSSLTNFPKSPFPRTAVLMLSALAVGIGGTWSAVTDAARSRTLATRKVLRAKIVLRRAKGESFRSIGQALDCDKRTAWQWVQRWEAAGFEGIEHEQEGRGRKTLNAARGADSLK